MDELTTCRKIAAMEGRDLEHQEFLRAWDDKWTPTFKNGLELRDHQKLGVAFMMYCEKKFGFCLVGDEMGFGKVPSIPSVSDVPVPHGTHLSVECCATVEKRRQRVRRCAADPFRLCHCTVRSPCLQRC